MATKRTNKEGWNSPKVKKEVTALNRLQYINPANRKSDTFWKGLDSLGGVNRWFYDDEVGLD